MYLTGNNNRPDSIALEKFLEENEFSNPGWIFIGSRKEKPSLAGLYRETVRILPKLLATETESFYFGASAFRAWAQDIEGGRFDCVKPEEFDPWGAHTAYVCGLATNASCCHGFLEKAMELNPDLGFLKEVSGLYKRCGEMWNHDNGTDLEALGGGFNVTLEALQDGQRRSRIADKLREFAEVTEEIERKDIVIAGLALLPRHADRPGTGRCPWTQIADIAGIRGNGSTGWVSAVPGCRYRGVLPQRLQTNYFGCFVSP